MYINLVDLEIANKYLSISQCPIPDSSVRTPTSIHLCNVTETVQLRCWSVSHVSIPGTSTSGSFRVSVLVLFLVQMKLI